MKSTITKAAAGDLPAVAQIYESIIARQAQGGPYIGWQSGIYPTLQRPRRPLIGAPSSPSAMAKKL